MKTVCIIPAKGNSRAIANKNLLDFCGKPLLAWSIIQAKKCDKVDRVYVSSDSKEILNVAWTYGAEKIRRPAKLAKDNSSSEDVILHAIKVIDGYLNDYDQVIFLQATSPLREVEDIYDCIFRLDVDDLDSIFSMSVLKDSTIWKVSDGKLSPALFDSGRRDIMRQDREKYYYENGSMYVFRVGSFKKYKNRICGLSGMYEMPFWKSFEIDEPEDVELCEFYFRNKILGGD